MRTFHFAVSVILAFALSGCGNSKDAPVSLVTGGLESFRDRLAELSKTACPVTNSTEGVRLFVSYGDERKRCTVLVGRGSTFDQAWEGIVRKTGWGERRPKWLRGEVLRSYEAIKSSRLDSYLFSRTNVVDSFGVSFDPEFKVVALPPEVQSRDFIHPKLFRFYYKRVLKFLTARTGKEVKKLPPRVYPFLCRGIFLDEAGEVHDLTYDEDCCGRRVLADFSKETVRRQIREAVDYLVSQVDGRGRFATGWKAGKDEALEGHNDVRHCGTVWAMSLAYEICPSPELRSAIDRAAHEIVRFSVSRDEKTAFVHGQKGRFSFGGTALAALALMAAFDVLQTDEFKTLSLKLGEGLLSMKHSSGKGWYVHYLDGMFNPLEKEFCVYYDGEAALAFLRLYETTQDRKWLEAGKGLVDFFIAHRKDYLGEHDHWQQYCLNAYTRLASDQQYWDYAMANLRVSADKYGSIMTAAPTDLELLMNGYETLWRMRAKGLTSAETPEADALAHRLLRRLSRIENHRFFPEIAMFMQNPGRCLGGFFSSNADFCVRIDGVQHTLGGLILLYRHAEEILPIVSNTPI